MAKDFTKVIKVSKIVNSTELDNEMALMEQRLNALASQIAEQSNQLAQLDAEHKIMADCLNAVEHLKLSYSALALRETEGI